MFHDDEPDDRVSLDELMRESGSEPSFLVDEKPKRKAKPASRRLRWALIVLGLVVLIQGVVIFLLLVPNQLSAPEQSVPPPLIITMPIVVTATSSDGTITQQNTFTINSTIGANSATPAQPTLLMAKRVDSSGCPVELSTEFKTTDQVYVTYQSPVQNQQSFWVQLSTNPSGNFFEEVYRLFPPLQAVQTYANACMSFGFDGAQLASLYGVGTYLAGVYQSSDTPLGNVNFTLTN